MLEVTFLMLFDILMFSPSFKVLLKSQFLQRPSQCVHAHACVCVCDGEWDGGWLFVGPCARDVKMNDTDLVLFFIELID